MKNFAFLFFALGVVFLSLGMVWGVQMGASGNHDMVGPHAHLNLFGGVLSIISGFYYNATPIAAESALARAHLIIHIIAVAIFVPGIALSVLEINHAVVGIGSFAALASMLLFLGIVFRFGLGRAA